jgi:myo-inositol-1(or 4)-monophosphatase
MTSSERPADDGVLERFGFGRALIEEAAALALDHFGKLDSLEIRSKGQQDMVSDADHDTERLIRTRLSERFPGDAFLGEETGAGDGEGSDGLWVVDPIDGTQPFTSGLTTWCVSVAYLYRGVPALGFVAAPARGELFVGSRAGATLNGHPISVRDADRLDQGLTYVGYSPWLGADDVLPVFGRLLRHGGQYYRDGSGALGLCYVACGRLIGYVERHMNAWDALAALTIVKAAGGRTNDFLVGDALRTGGHVIAGPSALYPTLTDLLGTPGGARSRGELEMTGSPGGRTSRC